MHSVSIKRGPFSRLFSSGIMLGLGLSVSAFAQTNLITNGTFDANTTGWDDSSTWSVSNFTMARESNKYCANVSTSGLKNGTETWQVTLRTSGIPYQYNHKYAYSADISSSIAGNVRLLASYENSSVTTEVWNKVEPVTATARTITGNFTFSTTVPAAATRYFVFQMGSDALIKAGSKVCFDNISLIDQGAVTSGTYTYSAYADPSDIRVNQVGYMPQATKIASIIRRAADSTTLPTWELRNSSNLLVASGTTTLKGIDTLSDETVLQADFSSVTTPGSYKLSVAGKGTSVEFKIADSLYPNLIRDAMGYYYFHRQFTPLAMPYVGNTVWAGRNVHPNDTAVACLTGVPGASSWCGGEKFNLAGSGGAWSDAGDFGIYPVNHAIAAWSLLNVYELLGATTANPLMGDGILNIPEQGNTVPDVLDEVAFGSRYLKAILPTNTSLHASHKVHGVDWGAFEDSLALENSRTRSARPGTTAASFAVARTYAELARRYQAIGKTTEAATYWTTAKAAYTRGRDLAVIRYHATGEIQPGTTYNQDVGGGAYDDDIVTDDKFAAAAEMFISAKAMADTTLVNGYKTDVQSYTNASFRSLSWQNVELAGVMSLIANNELINVSNGTSLKTQLLTMADSYLANINANGFPQPISTTADFYWGSNSTVANRGIVLAYAHKLSGDIKYLKALHRVMDYLMGTNPVKLSYVLGYGQYAEKDVHDRAAFTTFKQSNIPFPSGWLVGGPNSGVCEDGLKGTSGTGATSTPTDAAPAKRYAGAGEGFHAWCSKEIAINWNASLVWIATYINGTRNLMACTGANCQQATTASCDSNITTDTTVWNNTWQGQVIIQNTTSADLTSWTMDLQFDANTQLGAWGGPGSYDADVVALGGNKYRLTNKAWNGGIKKGAILTFGINGTAGPQANGTAVTPAGKPVISGTTCGTPLPKTVRFHSDHQNAIIYGTDGMGRLSGTNIRFFNSSTTPDDNLIFKIDTTVLPNFIHNQACCRGSLYFDEKVYPVGNHSMTLTTGSTVPQETDTVNFLLTNAKAECSFSNIVQSGASWTAKVNVTNYGYHPGSISTYYFEPALAADTVYKGKNWGVTISWMEDYPAVTAKGIKRNIVSPDNSARVKEDLTADGFNNPWYTYYFAPTDFIGELAGRAPNGTPATYSFNIKGDGTFKIGGTKDPQIGCSFGQLPSF